MRVTTFFPVVAPIVAIVLTGFIGSAFAEEKFALLADVSAEPMKAEELEVVRGADHLL